MHLVVADRVRLPGNGPAEAVLIDSGSVVALGSAQELRNHVDRVEAVSGVVIPGLRDAHFHPVTYAASLVIPSLKTAANIPEVGARLRAAAAGVAPGVPISAIRLDDESLAERRLPTRRDLDAVTGDRPVLIHRYCGHIAIANSAALQLAGVTAGTPDPPGGSLDRDEQGEPTGVLREMGIECVSLPLAELAGPAVTDDQLIEAMHRLASVGLTSLGGIVGCGDGPWADLGDQFSQVLRVADRLPINIRVLVIGRDSQQVREAARLVAEADSPRLTFLGVKIFGDGSLGGHTAAMHEPYADADTTGRLRFDPPGAYPLAETALDLGGMVAIHAIGDRANATVLDFYRELIEDGADPNRLRIEHASVLGPAEIAAFARLGVTASVQPAFIASETEWLERRVGAQRLAQSYPLRTLLDAGVPLAGGSDCPVEPPHPLWGMAAARDRCGMVPEESISGAEAFALFTTDAARALSEPEPLAVGSPADFIVLDQDPLSASPDELRQARVLATYVSGERVEVDPDAEVWAG